VSGTITTTVDFTSFIKTINLGPKVAMQDMTTFGDGGFVTQKPGLKNADLTIEFNQDFAAASATDVVFSPLFFNGTLLYLDIKPTSAVRSTTNASYVCACYVSDYPVLGNTVGDRAAVTIGFAITGTFARLTS